MAWPWLTATCWPLSTDPSGIEPDEAAGVGSRLEWAQIVGGFADFVHAARTDTVPKVDVIRAVQESITSTMYEDRDFAAMPILADALEEAGCDNPNILSHCREPGVHVRGCWVVDLVLGKS